jgi:SAM-dependent methyltransferase
MSRIETLDQVQKVGRERLYPSLTNPNWLVLRRRRQIFQSVLNRIPGAHLFVLDIGGRIQPYRKLLGQKCTRYTAVDLRITPLVNVVAPAQRLPFVDQIFDLVFCTQMLEYAPEPNLVVSEIHRVLKPDGWLLLSIPSLALKDSEEDYWRFWPAAAHHLLSCFSQVEIIPEGGSIAGLFRTIAAGLNLVAKFSVIRLILRFTLIPMLNVTGLVLEKLIHSSNDAFTVNYSVVARR